MADYTPLLKRAIIGQDEAARAGIYARAREALERQLRGFEPKLSDEQITAELAGLNTAINTVEAEASTPETAPDGTSVEAASATPAEPETPKAAESATPESEPSPPPPAEQPEPENEPAPLKAENNAPAPEAALPPAARQSSSGDSPGESPRDLDEAEVLKAANTDEVSSPPLVEPVIQVARPRMPLRDETRKSRKPVVMAAGAALIVILGMSALALSRRGSPDPLRAQRGAAQDVASAEAGKTEGRLASEAPVRPVETTPATPAPAPASNGTTSSEASLNTSTRAFMVLESPGNAPSQFEGRALWSFEPDPAIKGEKTLRTIIAFPGADITVDLSLSRNKDAGLGASHLMMAIFDVPKGFEPIREMSPIEWRERESQAGSVFRGSVVPVQDNVFMVTLDKTAQEANVALLRAQKWMVFEFRVANGRRGAVLVEKGAGGDKAADEALKAWK